MNQEKQTFNPKITPGKDMKDFLTEADQIEKSMLDDMSELDDKSIFTKRAEVTRTDYAGDLSKESRKKRLARRIAVGAAATAAILSPPGQASLDYVEDRIDQDRVFNPDQGNPDNTTEIVGSWDEDPRKTTIVVDGLDDSEASVIEVRTENP